MKRHLKKLSVDWMEVELGQDFLFLAAIPIGSKPFHSQSTSDPYVLPDPCRRNAPAPFHAQHLQLSLSASSASSC